MQVTIVLVVVMKNILHVFNFHGSNNILVSTLSFFSYILAKVEERRYSNTCQPRTSASQPTGTTQTSTTTNVAIRRSSSAESQLQRFWCRLENEWKTIPWDRLRSIKWKNDRAAPGCAYKPTEVS